MAKRKLTDLTLSTLAGGELEAAFQRELQRVAANIADERTDHKASRRITLTVDFEPDSDRDRAFLAVQAKTKLAPHLPKPTSIQLDLLDGEAGTFRVREVPMLEKAS